ncbi:helix-turn-helix domain-containing protein [Leptospira noguchii]|uniref:helix-turn-helix domain-containing protein n=1 Tax=Leptospira noguchii TaxID=28182 RepID=UPI000B2CCABC|nr:helix-turn-helix transcriptional regulator [Leptospira noguchii]UOG62614.1 helix-turn-helix domain-containing protein [Leptospira noguchii]
MSAELVSMASPHTQSRKRPILRHSNAQKVANSEVGMFASVLPQWKVSKKEKEYFYKALKTARKDAGFTQAEVAKKLKRSRSHISKIELGQRRLFMDEFLILYKLYGKPTIYFYSAFIKSDLVEQID